MNKRQRATLIRFMTVTIVTTIAVLAMINFKAWINRSEAMRAMKHLSQIVLQYRNEHGSIPPESYINGIRERLQGNVRLGDMQYRSRWIDIEGPPDEILAYAEKKYHSLLFSDGFIVLMRDGRVEWMEKKKFEELLAQQQSPMEAQMLKE